MSLSTNGSLHQLGLSKHRHHAPRHRYDDMNDNPGTDIQISTRPVVLATQFANVIDKMFGRRHRGPVPVRGFGPQIAYCVRSHDMQEIMSSCVPDVTITMKNSTTRSSYSSEGLVVIASPPLHPGQARQCPIRVPP